MSNASATQHSLPNRYQGVASVWGAADSSGRNTKVKARGEVVLPILPTQAPTPTPTPTPTATPVPPTPTPSPTVSPTPTATPLPPTPTPTPTATDIPPTPTPTPYQPLPFSNWGSVGTHGSNQYGGDLDWSGFLYFTGFDVPNNQANYIAGGIDGAGAGGFRMRVGGVTLNNGQTVSLDCGTVVSIAIQANYLFWGDIGQSVSNYSVPTLNDYYDGPTPTPTPEPTPTPTP